MLIPPGKNKNTTTACEPNFKQTLLNAGKDEGHWPGPCPGFPVMVMNYISQMPIKANPTRLPFFVQSGQATV